MATYGIDLGTTYSCIAYVDDTGRPVVAKNAIGEDTTPSVVFFENPDNVVVGLDAKKMAKITPSLVVTLIKRNMGVDDLELEYHGARHTPESISALILKELARAASEYAHDEVRDVVITVPAYFGVKEREATRNAGKIAGLNVLNIVPEPVAAALHYEAISAGSDRTILVYDLGGGTFDTTVIRLSGNDINVVCTDGDHRLGGTDWDDKVADYLLDQHLAEHPGSDAANDEDFLQELATEAENLKKALSNVERRPHNMRFGSEVTRTELSRETFERLTAELLERTFVITERTLAVAKEKGVTEFDDVLLVGGSTRMPAVASGLRARFGFEPKLHDPDLAVAKGAAQFALIEWAKVAMSGAADDEGGGSAQPRAVEQVADQLGIAPERVQRLVEKNVTTVVPRAFGVKVLSPGDPNADTDDFIVDHLLKANTALPASPPKQRYVTAFEDQTAIRVEIWEQAGAVESSRTSDNAKIGDGIITDLPSLPKGSPIDVTFHMNETGTLRVHAVEISTRSELEIQLQIGGLTEEQLETARDAVARYTVSA
jgi:molecular chaperone DnaK (HSP70)